MISGNFGFLRALALATLFLLAGCAADPSAHVAEGLSVGTPARSRSAVFASIDEAAVAALIAARETAPRRDRLSLQVGIIRRAGDGYVWMPPAVSERSILDMRPTRLRLRLAADAVALYVVHPRTGSPEMDARNESLNASESRLLGRTGHSRPVYLLTPHSRIVRHRIDESALELADLRRLRRAGVEATITARIE